MWIIVRIVIHIGTPVKRAFCLAEPWLFGDALLL